MTSAREEYNYALTAAKAGRLEVAARHLQRACELAPSEPRIWQLRLKVDAKLGLWQGVYRDLGVVDQLGERPAWAEGLEAMLPPLGPLT